MKALHSLGGVLGGSSGSPLVSVLITGDNFESFSCALRSKSMLPVHSWMMPLQVQSKESLTGCQHCYECFLVCIQTESQIVVKTTSTPPTSLTPSVMSKGCDLK